MKILMLAPQPCFDPRGTPFSVYQRIHALSSLGFQVDLVTYHLGRNIDMPGLRLCRTPHLSFIKKVRVGPSLVKVFLDALVLGKAIWLLLTRRYDVIHSHEEAAFFSVWLAFVFRKRHLYDMHSSLPLQLQGTRYGHGLLVRLFAALERSVIRTCDAVITIDTQLARHVKQIRLNARQITIENLPLQAVLPVAQAPGVDVRIQLHAQDRLLVVYTGTLEAYQGLELLLKTASIVKRQRPEVFFLIVGGSPAQVEEWTAKARHYKLEDCTRFAGAVSPEESLAFIAVADILVSPRAEGMAVPLKIFTYLHSGKPIVATRIAPHTAVLNEQIGYLAAPEPAAFAAGILHLAGDADLRSKLGRNALQFARRNYTFEAYRSKINSIYETMRPQEERQSSRKQIGIPEL